MGSPALWSAGCKVTAVFAHARPRSGIFIKHYNHSGEVETWKNKFKAGVVNENASIPVSGPTGASVRYDPISAVVLAGTLELSISFTHIAWRVIPHTPNGLPSSSGSFTYVRSGHDSSAVPAVLDVHSRP
ncbi:hypothetical protein LZ30DRAFT_691640 [Colletotrichum cereale]|nr:hypothetical protein LZ30DRAFT_691640 [Colletotrichum cereale]